MNNVKRNSPNDKLGGLINAAKPMFTEMLHSSWLKSLPFEFTSKRLNRLSDLSTLQAFLINIVLIFALYRSIDENEYNKSKILLDDKFLGTLDSNILINILGLI